MSADKYRSIFSPQNGDYSVYYSSNLFATYAVLKIEDFSWGILGHVTCLDLRLKGWTSGQSLPV